MVSLNSVGASAGHFSMSVAAKAAQQSMPNDQDAGTEAAETAPVPLETGGQVVMFLNPAVSALATATMSAEKGSADPSSDIPFSETIRGIEPQPIDGVLLLLNQDVSEPESAGPDGLGGYTRMTKADLPPEVLAEIEANGGRVDDNGQIHGPAGLLAAIYSDEQGNVVVVYAGTGDLGDGYTDLVQSQGWMLESGQYEFAMDLGIVVEKAYPGDVAFTGHSLGGGLASTSAAATGGTAVTFNAAGPHEDTLEMARAKRKEAFGEDVSVEELVAQADAGQIRNYYVEGEGLTWLQEGGDQYIWVGGLILMLVPATATLGAVLVIVAPVPDAQGNLIGIDDPEGGNPLDKHKMSSVVAAANTAIPVVIADEMTGSGTISITVASPLATASYADGGGDPAAVGESVNSDAAVPVGTTLVTVEFEDSAEGQAAADIFRMTGKIPENQEGVVKTTMVEKITSGPDAGTALTVVRTFGADGKEILPERRYLLSFEIRTETDILMLREMGYEGELEIGQVVTLSYDEAEMTELEADAEAANGNTDMPTALSGMTGHGDQSGSFGFALALVTVGDGQGQNTLPQILHLIANWVDGDPDPATVKDMFGE